MGSDRPPKRIGLAIVGAGRIGLIRGEIAARHPSVGWIGIAETRADRGKQVAERLGADFVTTDFRELLRRPEATAAVIATDEHLHVDPILAAVERGLPLMIEKPLAEEGIHLGADTLDVDYKDGYEEVFAMKRGVGHAIAMLRSSSA